MNASKYALVYFVRIIRGVPKFYSVKPDALIADARLRREGLPSCLTLRELRVKPNHIRYDPSTGLYVTAEPERFLVHNGHPDTWQHHERTQLNSELVLASERAA